VEPFLAELVQVPQLVLLVEVVNAFQQQVVLLKEKLAEFWQIMDVELNYVEIVMEQTNNALISNVNAFQQQLAQILMFNVVFYSMDVKH